ERIGRDQLLQLGGAGARGPQRVLEILAVRGQQALVVVAARAEQQRVEIDEREIAQPRQQRLVVDVERVTCHLCRPAAPWRRPRRRRGAWPPPSSPCPRPSSA